MRAMFIAVAGTLAWLAPAAALPAAEGPTVEPGEQWADFFGGEETMLHYAVRATEAVEGRLDWVLVARRATVAHGELPLRLAAGRAAEVAWPLKMPEAKEGVILEAELGVAVWAAGGGKPVAQHVRKLWIFPRDLFAQRKRWLQGLKITLFDPVGKTVDVLRKARVPCKFTKNTAALDELREGMLVIGEGTAWRDYRSLGEAMVKAAARGVPVLCLAPGEGAMALPNTDGTALPSPRAFSLRQADVISELDQRLDAVAWPPQGRIAAARLALKADRGLVVAEAASNGPGWPWLELRYPASKGRLIVCGFPIIHNWEATPAARYLFAELLARLDVVKQPTPSLPIDLLNRLPQEERKD